MFRRSFLPVWLSLALGASSVSAPAAAESSAKEISTVEISDGVTLRRAIWRTPDPQGYVLLLHGFPETVHAWDAVAAPLAETHEVHAFDWPGYGLSSRPPAERFGYAPRDYARVLKAYLATAGIDRSRLTIYATDIGALPALLLALDEPGSARRIIVGDFAPFDRPGYMYPSLQSLKSPATAEPVRAHMNRTRDEILAGTFYRGLPDSQRFEISDEFAKDLRLGWDAGDMSSADAFYHYYASFTRDQAYLEKNAGKLRTAGLKVIWGRKDLYIDERMGVEFAERVEAELILMPDVGHYPHLQAPARVSAEIRAAFR
ncbi:alpha/beta fold hydrolase [Allosphingosinicella deserti]|uniref:Alpha/beta hydrolase n=1 Tax=Allosphingosinicella deserti TaxID=2116704 RepID=A0A2P7QZQ4_9SPHN|nr:alpha/beta hydrolase [Sphingomonas deserti]PSJ43452.1 alpha/beta hydrolase [Sphingomonas deserti]